MVLAMPERKDFDELDDDDGGGGGDISSASATAEDKVTSEQVVKAVWIKVLLETRILVVSNEMGSRKRGQVGGA